MNSPCLETKVILPGWWILAYEALAARDSQCLDPFQLSEATGISPVLNTSELVGFGSVLGKLQKDILHGHHSSSLHPLKHKMNHSFKSRSKTFAFERVLQILGSMKIVDRTAVAGTVGSVALFNQEKWIKNSDEVFVDLEYSEHGKQMLLGYAEPFTCLRYYHLMGGSFRQLMGDANPLLVNQSVWLDLHGIEFAILLKIEKAIQSNSALVRLDGSFSIALGELFRVFSDFLGGRAKKVCSFQQNLAFLKRLGVKLKDHGVLDILYSDDYFALNDAPVGQLVWKGAASQVFSRDLKEYESRVARYFVSQVITDRFEDNVKMLSGKLYDVALLKQLKRMWSEILEGGLADAAFVVESGGGSLCVGGALFLEWTVRQLPGHSYPLPDELLFSELASLARHDAQGKTLDRLHKFVKVLACKSDVVELILGHPRGTLMSGVASKDRSALEFLNHSKVSADSLSNVTYGPKSKNESITPEQQKNDSRFAKKKATATLIRIREEDPSRYSLLKKSYLESLDSNGRKIMNEVQQRLQPSLFEEQIKHGLIKYMLDNSSTWLH